jgi:branched-chain amino acid transport system ATP-binding protein
VLEIQGVSASYGAIRALEKVSLTLPAGGLVCLLGANGAGKTTTVNCIAGVVPVSEGAIRLEGEDITDMSIHSVVARGIVQVPEGRELFAQLTVQDNLRLGTWLHRRKGYPAAEFERVYHYFPRLKERAKQLSGTLSGGEQQMLMIARALMARPRYLLLDEPSLGLSPILIQQIFSVIPLLQREGMAILLVEQNASVALACADYGYIMENGEIRLHGPARELADNPEVRAAYLGT